MKRRNFIGSLFAAGGVLKKSQPVFLGKDIRPYETITPVSIPPKLTIVGERNAKPEFIIKERDLLLVLKRNGRSRL